MKKTIQTKRLLILLSMTICLAAGAQEKLPEFSKKAICVLSVHSGLVTNFEKSNADVFVGGIDVSPQFRVIDKQVRLGVNTGINYLQNEWVFLGGPMVAIKLVDQKSGPFPFLGMTNLHLVADYQWGTQKQSLAGMGIMLELLQKVHIGSTLHRNTLQKNWWLQMHIGFDLLPNRKSHQTIPDPQ